MPIDVLFAGVATADLEAAIVWYEALLGRPANVIVNDDEVMWQIRDGAWLYLLRDPSHAGHGLVTVSVPDLDQEVAEIADRGLDPPTIETIESAGRKASYFDPDGNMVSFVEVFSSDGSAQRGRTRATPAEGPLPPRSRPSRAVLRW
jgi:catechol 2,3-dioxygenase-like lactoylglutathione lyase family enzyme